MDNPHCPHCGRCKHCGQPNPPQYYTWPPYIPWYQQWPIVITEPSPDTQNPGFTWTIGGTTPGG